MRDAPPTWTPPATREPSAAGALANSPSNLTEWIQDPQRVKPGTHMPATALAAADLQAVLVYLEGLE